jgi:hypothetical protein
MAHLSSYLLIAAVWAEFALLLIVWIVCTRIGAAFATRVFYVALILPSVAAAIYCYASPEFTRTQKVIDCCVFIVLAALSLAGSIWGARKLKS